MIRSEEIAWLAGFIDGEGSISIEDPKKTRYPKLSIGQNRRDVLEHCADIVEQIVGYRPPVYETLMAGRPFFAFRVCRQAELALLLSVLLPFLRRKGPQAAAAIHLLVQPRSRNRPLTVYERQARDTIRTNNDGHLRRRVA